MSRACPQCEGPVNDQGVCWSCFKRPTITEKDFEPFFEVDTRSDWRKLIEDYSPPDRLWVMGLSFGGWLLVLLGTEVLEVDAVTYLGLGMFACGLVWALVKRKPKRTGA